MTLLDVALIVVALAGLVQFVRCMSRDISIDIMFTPEKNAEDDSLKALVDYIAELEEEQVILKDQQREAKNILIDKNLHIDSLYEEGYKLQQRIAELEGFIGQLIKAGNGMKSFLTPYVDGFRDSYPATSAWESLVKDWKEG